MKKILTMILLLSSLVYATPYSIDVSHSTVSFKVKHMMVSKVTGNFKNFSGLFEYDEKIKAITSINAEIKVASINTEDEKRDIHLRNADFFDAKKFKTITFVSKSIEGDKVVGDLTMKGVTKSVTLEYEFGGTTTNPWGKKIAGFSLYGKIDRRDFGITWNKVLDVGGIAVSNDVKLSIEVEGVVK